MQFVFSTTALGAGGAQTAAQIVMPSYAGVSSTTGVAGVKARSTDESHPLVRCTGDFCSELLDAGFEFELVIPTVIAVPTASHSGETIKETAHATLHILT
jgi:hypothetical protein